METVNFDKMKQLWAKTNRWHIWITVFVIGELGLLPAGKQAFVCQDPSLSYTFNGDTISWKSLLVTTILLPFVIMLIVEKWFYKNQNGRQSTQAQTWYKEYLFGLLLNLTIVQYTKTFVGAPRPHFFDTCRPLEAETCTGSEVVTTYTCGKSHWLSTSNRSFPSGHSSMAFQAAIFVAWYFHQRLPSVASVLSVRVCQSLAMLAAILCAGSRVMDHRHHVRDVLVGAAVAVVFSLYTILVLCENFRCADRTQVQKLPEKMKTNETGDSVNNL